MQFCKSMISIVPGDEWPQIFPPLRLLAQCATKSLEIAHRDVIICVLYWTALLPPQSPHPIVRLFGNLYMICFVLGCALCRSNLKIQSCWWGSSDCERCELSGPGIPKELRQPSQRPQAHFNPSMSSRCRVKILVVTCRALLISSLSELNV